MVPVAGQSRVGINRFERRRADQLEAIDAHIGVAVLDPEEQGICRVKILANDAMGVARRERIGLDPGRDGPVTVQQPKRLGAGQGEQIIHAIEAGGTAELAPEAQHRLRILGIVALGMVLIA